MSYHFEGVIAKRKGSPYLAGTRSSHWLKIKILKTVDCIITGYTHGEGHRASTFGALKLALYNEKHKLVDIGKVGTGWTDYELKKLTAQMDELIQEQFQDYTKLAPQLVCEVEYLEVTSHHDLRSPSFRRLRKNRNPKSCTLRQIL